MTSKELYQLLQAPEYSIFQTEPHLENNLLFLVVMGSRGYNVANENSDIDVRGVALNSRSDLLGMTNWDGFFGDNPDTSVYSLKKYVHLLMHGAPPLMEMLYMPPKNILLFRQEAQILFDNRNLFLSQGLERAFIGYYNKAKELYDKALRKGDIKQAAKCQYHQIRLLLEYYELLGSNTMTVYRTDSTRYLLLGIRDGNALTASNPTNDFHETDSFSQMKANYLSKIHDLEKEAKWPEHPDFDAINNMVIHINQAFI